MGNTQIFGMSLLSFCNCWKFGSLDCGLLECVQLIVFLFVGRCCLGQDECYFARSFGISFCLLMFWISLVC